MYESDAGGPRLQVQHDNRAAALDVWVVGQEDVASDDNKGWRKKRIGWGGFVPLLSSEAAMWTEAEEEGGGGGEGGTGMMRMMRMRRMRMKKMRERRRSYSSGGKYWCVARPWAEADMVQAALDWACSHSAECRLIQLAQPCYVPNTLLSHASFAFNSYFQIHGQASGTCDFGGTAMITNIDPSEFLSSQTIPPFLLLLKQAISSSSYLLHSHLTPIFRFGVGYPGCNYPFRYDCFPNYPTMSTF
jgi:hypothetical protein